MVGESFLSLACAGLIALMFGLVLCFSGYRFFLVLLPIWGFFFGLTLGAQSMQALFGTAFLATISSWVVGFIVGAIFAVLSYLFWVAAVAIMGGSLGYALAAGVLTAIGLPLAGGFIAWLVAIVVGVVFALAVLFLNIQKWIVVIATAVLGAGTIIGTFVLMFNPAARFLQNPVQVALQTSPLLAILFLVLAAIGIVSQVQTTRHYEVNSYNRWTGEMPENIAEPAGPTGAA